MPFIYAMCHPITLEIRYIGKVNKPPKRFREHRYIRRETNTHKKNWVIKLRSEGLNPAFFIIEEVDQDQWKECERFWIAEFKSKGFTLLNSTSGGDGLSMGSLTSFKKGHKPWNTGTGKPKAPLKGNVGKTEQNIKNHFKKGQEPWNKNISGYSINRNYSPPQSVRDQISNKLKGRTNTGKSKVIKQIDMKTNQVIKEFPSTAEVRRQTGIYVTNCMCGRAKSAGGYKWEY